MTTIAIIGSGPAGLVSAKTALECGLKPTVFEKGSTIGGLCRERSGAVWETMRTNLSHRSCMFSDFEWEETTEDFPNQKEVNGYLHKYAAAFQITPHLHLDSDVQSISPLGDRWSVEWIHEGQKTSGLFDFLIVASGIFSKAFIPSIPGIETFTGSILHANDYKTPESFKEKNVVREENKRSHATPTVSAWRLCGLL